MSLSRRTALAALGATLLSRSAWAAGLPPMRVHKDPNCGCCTGWVEHVRAAGFPVDVLTETNMDAIKLRLGVPAALSSCHSAEVDGYVIEGHVPAAEIIRLLAERPRALGLAVADMPVGSPGMEVPGARPDVYPVVLFGSGQSIYARYRGGQRI
ncbi:DUF411 domain-containing protein [Alsobacter sp. R-9]